MTDEACRGVDVAVDFSTPEATLATAPRLAARGVSLVVGTTGWLAHEAELREAVARAGVGAVVAANFSLGANVLDALAEAAARLLAGAEAYGAFVHEAHHAAKKDAPSGTALMLRRALERGGWTRPVDVASTRAGSIPGTHTVGLRRAGRDGRARAHRAGPRHLRARGPRRGTVGRGEEGLVHDA